MVAPLASIVRLKHGNIGRKGPVSCVWQSQKEIMLILPVLPAECKTLIVSYDKKKKRGLSSFKCRRDWIARALYLLKSTGAEPWSEIVINKKNLEAWPLNGNLLELVPEIDVDEDSNNKNASLNREDDSSLGPAPEQNHEPEDAVFVGLVLDNEVVDATGRAQHANNELVEFATADNKEGEDVRIDRTEMEGSCPGTPGEKVVAVDVAIDVIENRGSPPSPLGQEVVGDLCTEVDPCPPRNLFGDPIRNIVPGQSSTVGDEMEASPHRPEVTVREDGESALLNCAEVFPKGGFVNMKSTRWAWAMSFPTLFPPTLSNGEWVTLGDPTACARLRDQTPTLAQWGEWMMWRNDGGPARHPTFALILNAELTQTSLLAQGGVFLARQDIPSTMSLEQFQDAYKDKKKRRAFHDNLQHAAGNVRGTDQYWKGVRNKFKAAIFYMQYVKKKEFRYFITGSQAEYHDPFLRRLLSKYVTSVRGIDAGIAVMNSQEHWFNAVMDYKNIVTHFFAFKNEQWYFHFLKHTLGVDDFQGRYEFTKARGAIHAHGSAASDKAFDKSMDAVFSDLALQVYELAKVLDGGSITQQTFVDKSALLSDRAASRLTNLMERVLGISASHVGKPPGEWVAPAGRSVDCGHRCDTVGMLDMKDVKDTQVLHKFKFDHERELYRRRVDITNICQTHTCSSYCWRNTHVSTVYVPEVHDGDPEVVRVVRNTKRKGSVAVMRVGKCRMGYGYAKKFPRNKCRTGGKDAVRKPVLLFDVNGQPVLSVPRNHPRVLQEPIHVLHWGANADIQRFMNNATTLQSFNAAYEGKSDSYDDFCKQLEQHGMRGLEAATGCHTANDYTCNYQCKGAESTAEWSQIFSGLVDKLFASEEDTHVRSLVGKSMHLIAKSRDCSKDEASFSLGGGELYFTTQPVKMCSMKSVELSDIGDVSGGTKKWTFESLRKRYENRNEHLDLNLYVWSARHGTASKAQVAPYFTGHSNRPTFPLEEGYSKSMLQLYKPYRGAHNHDGFLSYNHAFTVFMDTNPLCPLQIVRAVRAKRERSVFLFFEIVS
jgi:hypothetical protein